MKIETAFFVVLAAGLAIGGKLVPPGWGDGGRTDADACIYDLFDLADCSVAIARETVGGAACPDLCLVGDPALACAADGLDARHGRYETCVGQDGSWFARGAAAAGEFSMAVAALGGESCGTADAPARLVAVSDDIECTASDAMLGQAGCSVIARVRGADGSAECAHVTRTLSDVGCGAGVLRASVSYAAASGKARFHVTRGWHVAPDAADEWAVDAPSPATWPPYGIVVGDEASGGRAWCGTIASVCLSAGANASAACGAWRWTSRDPIAGQHAAPRYDVPVRVLRSAPTPAPFRGSVGLVQRAEENVAPVRMLIGISILITVIAVFFMGTVIWCASAH